jgi:GrpB-like predicted nucleotidyltransferase (UPF0157 family)
MSIEWFDRPKGDAPVLEEPDAAWSRQAGEWIRRLSAALAPLDVRVEHVGSTAIPGLAAKPVIDLQVAVPVIDDEHAYRPTLEGLGLILRAREPGHRFFRPPGNRPRTIHVHVCQQGSTWEREHLLFRDFLKAHPARAERYAALKRELATTVGGDRIAYSEGKRPFIEQALAQAETWARRTGWTPTQRPSPSERQRHVGDDAALRPADDDIHHPR